MSGRLMDPPAEPAADAEPPEPEAPPFALDLVLPPEAARRLSRHPALTAIRRGRARSQPVALLWLDTADGALAADHLMAEQVGAGPTRLIRLRPEPDARTWPGQPDTDAPGEPPEGLAAVASFRGRRSVTPCADGVSVELVSGQIRAVPADLLVARLRLAGPAQAVFALARALAEDLPVLPATASLAEIGRALAAQEPPRPRRSGPALLGEAADAGAAVASAIGHLGLAMLHQREGALAGTEPEPVHQMRVALRRLRAILRLFRDCTGAPALLRLEGELKALAGRLGPARDWDVFLAGIGAEVPAAVGEDARLVPLLRKARAAREEAYDGLRDALGEPEFRLLALDIAEAAARPEAWRAAAPAADTALHGLGAALLERRWRKLRKRGRGMGKLDLAAFHALRIEAKRLRYAAELFAPHWPGKATRRFLRRLARLQDAMGLANDAEVARGLIGGLHGKWPGREWAGGLFDGWCLARVATAREKSLSCFAKLEKCKPFWRGRGG
ncbi:MAG: CHAD domain-containing protein [Acetobacteraceae bacterium]|nr:CHAD domain-containing protein [Acetobacteraceae bacterium]